MVLSINSPSGAGSGNHWNAACLQQNEDHWWQEWQGKVNEFMRSWWVASAWLWMSFIFLILSFFFLSAPESVDSRCNGDWRVSWWHQEAHTTLHSESNTPMCDHMHVDKCIHHTKFCDLLSCEELAHMFPYGAISVRFDSNMSSTNKNSFVIDYVYFRPCLGPLKPFFKLFHNHYHGLAIMPHMSCHKVIIIGFSGHKH